MHIGCVDVYMKVEIETSQGFVKRYINFTPKLKKQFLYASCHILSLRIYSEANSVYQILRSKHNQLKLVLSNELLAIRLSIIHS